MHTLSWIGTVLFAAGVAANAADLPAGGVSMLARRRWVVGGRVAVVRLSRV